MILMIKSSEAVLALLKIEAALSILLFRFCEGECDCFLHCHLASFRPRDGKGCFIELRAEHGHVALKGLLVGRQ